MESALYYIGYRPEARCEMLQDEDLFQGIELWIFFTLRGPFSFAGP
jgi:hypothetical protein